MTHCKRIGVAFLAACSALGLTAAVHAQTPTILSAYGEYDSGTLDQYVDITFNEDMNGAGLDPFNYSIANNLVLDAERFINNQGVGSPNQVILPLENALTGDFMLSVSNLQGVSGNPIAATLDPLSSIDITSLTAATPEISAYGTTFYEGPGSYLVDASGNDIWNDQDGFRYVYTLKTNNFAVVVQVPYVLPADSWTKAGLMARETIDASDGGSRMVSVFTTAAGNQNALDGSGGGQNTLSMAVRDTTDAGAYEPGNYIGDYNIAPSYPNQWLMLTRQTDGTNDLFTIFCSTDDANWTWMDDWSPVSNGVDTVFPNPVYVGMCTSAHVGPPGSQLATASYQNFGDYAVHLFLTNSPTDVTVESGASATFSVLAGSDSTFRTNGVTGLSFGYQWYTITPPATNGVAVPGANASIYTIPLTTTNMSGMKVYCRMSAISPFTAATNSATATLTVLENTEPPTMVSAFGEYDSGTSNQYVDVTFNEAMNASSILNPANYSISNYTITSVMLYTNDLGVGSTNQVILQLSKPLTNSFTLVVKNLQSFSGIAILAADTTVAGTLDPMSSIDIGIISLAGTTYYQGPGSYLVNSSGEDIGPNQDGFRFVYTTRTNNFAVVVQVPWMLPADSWSKAGLMARATIDSAANGGDGGSPMVAVYTTAAATQLGLDGFYGENTLSFQARYTNDGPANEPPVPANYIGDGAIAPSFPNQWLLLTRITVGTNDLFTAYASTNEADWTWVGDFNPVETGSSDAFLSVVNVGMCASTDIYPPNDWLVTAMYQNFGDYVVHVSVINSPTNVTVESGTSATFSVVAGADSTVSINGVTSLFVNYQWFTNGAAVPGATASIYTTPLTTTNLTGEQVYCAISAFGSTTNSAKATLTVVENPAPPTIVSAFAEYDSGTLLPYVDITFSENMNVASALNPANYSIAGYTITGVMFFTNNTGVGELTNVILQLNKPLTGSFTLTVTNVQSFSSIAILAADTTFAGTADPLTSIDIGDITTNGATYYEGPGSYLVDASGNDIWNAQDGFRFVYTTRTNNFAVAVQVPSIIPADTWSKAGLMARETIDPSDGGSRMIYVVTTALTNQIPLDGGVGQGTLSMGVRDTPDQGAYEPADYIGDGVIAPVYPNQWLLLARRTDGANDLFTVYGSTNNVNWTWMADFNPVTTGEDTPFPGVVNVGMCTTAHVGPPNADLATVMYQNFGDYINHVFLTNSPKSVTVESGTSATFSVLVGSDSTVLYNGATNPLVDYQWYTNGVAVPGAIADIYTTPLTTTNLTGEQVYCAISSIGGTTTNSATATLTVVPEAPPTIVSALGEYDRGRFAANQFVDVTFSQAMNAASLLNPANYSIAGYTITGVKLFTNDLGVGSTTMVILQLSKPLTSSFTLVVNGVRSVSGVGIAADTSVAGTEDPLASIDIGIFSLAGTTYYEGPGSYLVNASGQDIWNDQDGFRYVYTTRTNNFDVVVQVPYILPADMWSKAGLMARESIDPSDGGSRMAAVVTTPAADQLGLDGSYGANTLSFQVRDKTDAGAYEPGVNGAAGLYIGDFVLAPSYPNQWLRLTRQTDGVNDLFTAYASTNNADWTWLGEFNPVDTGASNAFPSVVNVGLCASTDIYPPNDWLVTAMYQNFGNYVKVVEGPTLTVTFVAASSSLTISWTPAGGSLYSSPVLGSGAVWTLVTANNPATIPITKSEPTMFFKVISP